MNNKGSPSIRQGVTADFEALVSLDSISNEDPLRRRFIGHSIETGSCWVITEQEVFGYGVIEQTFFGNGFISMIYIHKDRRRKGFGVMLLRFLESKCATEKLFTSTNLSHTLMQTILNKEGYHLCGTVLELEEGDPELIYLKRIYNH